MTVRFPKSTTRLFSSITRKETPDERQRPQSAARHDVLRPLGRDACQQSAHAVELGPGGQPPVQLRTLYDQETLSL